MTWLEVIKVRFAGSHTGSLDVFLRSLEELRKDGLIATNCYRHASLETDLMVHILWESSDMDEQGSPLGIALARAFHDFGLVDHSLWRQHSADGEGLPHVTEIVP